MIKLVCSGLLASILMSLPAYADPDTAYAQLSSLKTQIPSSTKPAAIIMDSVDLLHNFEVSPKRDKLITKVGGVYFIIASGQSASMNKSDSGHMDLWFVKNSQPIPNSNCRMSVDNPISNSVLITQFLIALQPGDTIGTNFSANAPSLGFVFSQPDNEPANTSFLFSILKVE
jgi:hypothetical protein